MTLRNPDSLQLSPDVFAVVMATGILSVAARDHSYQSISCVLAGLAASSFVLLCLVALLQLTVGRAARIGTMRDPDVALRLFTFVAACAVLGSRFHTRQWVTRVLAAGATVAWLILIPLAVADLRSRPRRELRTGVTVARRRADPVILVLWIGATAWIPILLRAEMWRLKSRPESVHVAGIWWSAVFPLGMYSTATQAVGQQLHLPGLSTVSLVVFWAGFGLWGLITAGFVHAAGIAVSGSPRQR